jgi:hypothetical protein
MSIQQLLNYYGIRSIWHFTDESNLISIEKYGILSLRNIIRQQLEVACYGADQLSHELDTRKGLDQFVHLSFIKEHPMQFVKTRDGLIPNPVWLEIDASVLFNDNTIFSNQVANKTGAQLYNIRNLADYIDLDVLWGRTDWKNPDIKERRKVAKYGELMIKNQISVNNILGVTHG